MIWLHFHTHPSLLILLVRSSHRLFVSTKMMVLFSFSLMISSSRRISLKDNIYSVKNLSKKKNHVFSSICHNHHGHITYLFSFSPSLQTSTICRMLWLALSCSAPTLIWTYSFRKSSASWRTSFGQVALHIKVWRSGCETPQQLATNLQVIVMRPFMAANVTLKDTHSIKTHSDLVDNFPDLWLKAHVQHSVSLVQHKVSASSEICLPCLKEVDEPAWCGNADLHTCNRFVTVRTTLLTLKKCVVGRKRTVQKNNKKH